MDDFVDPKTYKEGVAKARALWMKLSNSDNLSIHAGNELRKSIHEELRKIGADASVLNPNGRHSAEVMEDAIDRAVIRYEIGKIRDKYERFLKGDTFGYSRGIKPMLDDIYDDLKRHGINSCALDPLGQKSDAEIDAIIWKTGRKHQVEAARHIFKRLLIGDFRGYEAPVLMAEDIREKLAQFELSSACLDPMGKKSADEVDNMMQSGIQFAEVLDRFGAALPLPRFGYTTPAKTPRK